MSMQSSLTALLLSGKDRTKDAEGLGGIFSELSLQKVGPLLESASNFSWVVHFDHFEQFSAYKNSGKIFITDELNEMNAQEPLCILLQIHSYSA